MERVSAPSSTTTDVAVSLVPLTTEHAPAMFRWMCDPVISGNIGLRSVPTAERTVAWIERAASDETISAWAILADGEHVGNVILDRIDRDLGTTRVSIYIGGRRGRGVGTQAMRLILEKAFGRLALRKVWLTVFARNQQALALYSGLGFRIDRIVEEDVLFEGERGPVVYMTILSDEGTRQNRL
jgi:RimJ/RimL family protein N-acetyltransferase